MVSAGRTSPICNPTILGDYGINSRVAKSTCWNVFPLVELWLWDKLDACALPSAAPLSKGRSMELSQSTVARYWSHSCIVNITRACKVPLRDRVGGNDVTSPGQRGNTAFKVRGVGCLWNKDLLVRHLPDTTDPSPPEKQVFLEVYACRTPSPATCPSHIVF